MNKETALDEFIKGLRIAFNNSLAYQRHHPYFIKSVEEFRQKAEVLFGFLNPIKLNITPESLFIDDKYWAKPLTYVELAKLLHQRKIKAIEFRQGVNTDELADFFSALALSPKEAVKSGGFVAVLKRSQAPHITAEELDYSELLSMQGSGEYDDVWRYLFKGAMSSKDVNKISDAVKGFSESLKNINAKDLVEDEELKQDLVNFFRYLKENDKNGFFECSNVLFNYLVSSKDALSHEEIQSLRSIFKGFNENDFADILRTQVSKSDNPDPLFLNLFSMFSQGASSENAEFGLSRHNENRGIFEKDPLSAKRIQAFLANPDSQSVSPVYRNTLFSLLKNISYSNDFDFDPLELRVNYRFVLLNMLNQKKDTQGVKFILANLDKEWLFIVKDKDYGYIKCLLQVINEKLKEGIGILGEFDSLRNKIAILIEEAIWAEEPNESLDYLVDSLDKSRKGSEFYLNKIFQEDKICVYGLKLFLKFFPVELDIFYSGVAARGNDLEYSSRIVRMIAGLNSNLSLAMLKQVYSFSNELIKVEILKAMQELSLFDREFLLNLLQGNSRIIKKEALKALSRDSESLKAGIAIVLKIRSPWGLKNNLILENMAIIEELNLKEGVSYLATFAKMNLFWHAPLKKKALSVLEGLK